MTCIERKNSVEKTTVFYLLGKLRVISITRLWYLYLYTYDLST